MSSAHITPPPRAPLGASVAVGISLALGLTVPRAAEAAGRIVAVGDLHADLPHALATLQMTRLVDAAGHWCGKDATLVITGDYTDRGPDGRPLIELLQRLEAEAKAAGGAAVLLIGNHEAMNLQGDWRYVNPVEMGQFGGEAGRRQAYSADGAVGRWLLEHPPIASLDGTVYLHGGISQRFAPQGVDGLNAATAAALRGAGPADVLGPEGPLWYRGYLLADESVACAELETALTALGARRMVIGHTTQESGKIAVRCGGALLGIDTGISAHYGGHHAAVELTGDDARAIYVTGTVDLPDPPRAPPRAPPPAAPPTLPRSPR